MMEIYGEFNATLSRINPKDDLKWYSVNYGTDMAYNWPEFEVCTLDHRSFMSFDCKELDRKYALIRIVVPELIA